MGRRLFVFLFASLISFSSQALRIEDVLVGPSGLSAKRPPQTSFLEMAKHHELFSEIQGKEFATVYMSRSAYDSAHWDAVPQISAADLQVLFNEVRDRRLLKDSQGRDRRLTWLFPDNGCFARAELMNEEAGRMGLVKPAKIFVFGNLTVRTDFHPDGMVTWWYHVAPIVKVGTEIYVLDPSMDPYRPLLVSDWVGQMNSSVDVSICSAHSYDPDSLCRHRTGSQADRAVQDEAFFLFEEWNRVLDLGRTPEEDLGDYPPWAKSSPRP